jgi:FkbM family methyltransferase
MKPDALLWKTLEFYGIRVHHRGKSRVHNCLRSLLRADYDGDLEVERQGLRWRLNPSDFVQTHLYWTDEYEPWDLLHLSRWAKPGSVVFDIGANFGYYSLVLASAMGRSGSIFAFEPASATFSRLTTNISLNQLESVVKPIRCALSDTVGTARLEGVAGNSGATTFSLDGNGESVVLDTLDRFCVSQSISEVHLIKIDVEGNELRVLEGGHAALTRWLPVLMVEFNRVALERSGASTKKLAGLLEELGYELFISKRDRLLPFQFDRHESMIVNVLCLPASKISDLHPMK